MESCPSRPSPVPWVLWTLGAGACLIGGAAVAGWHLGLRGLVQWSSTFPLMVYDTAWGVTAGGVALLSLGSGRGGAARVIGLLILMLGLGHVAFDPPGGLGYRDLLPHSVPSSMTAFPGRGPIRMAPTTVAAFSLLGLALVFLGRGRLRSWIGASAASLVLLLACTSILGVVTGFGFYLWGGIFLGMALPTATAFGILGAGVLLWTWEQAPCRWGGWPEWAPVPVVALVLGCTLMLGQSHQAELRLVQRAQEEERMAGAGGHLRSEWQRLGLQLADLAGDGAFEGRGGGAAFEATRTRFLKQHPGLRSLAWAPESDARSGWEGDAALFLTSPPGPKGRLRLVLDADPWVGAVLRPHLSPAMEVHLHRRRPPGAFPAAGGRLLIPVELEGVTGVLELGPDPRSWVPGRGNALAGLMTGLLVAGLVGGLVWSAQDGRERAARLALEVAARTKAERRQQEFLAIVSHELRTPLTAIQGALKLLKHMASGALSQRDLELLDMADRNGEKLLRLVNDLLDMERLSRGQTTLAPKALELGALVRLALSNHEPTFRSRGISGRYEAAEGEVWIQGDPHRLEQVVANLLSNATKFSRAGGEVVAAVGLVAGEARLEIRDQGEGIPDAFRDRIFQPFTQAEDANVRREGGSGLGLAISKALVEAMGGAIGFESEAGRGSTFWMTFPLLAPPTEGVPERLDHPAPAGGS